MTNADRAYSGIIPFRIVSEWNGDELDVSGSTLPHSGVNWLLDRTPVRTGWMGPAPVADMLASSHVINHVSHKRMAAVFSLHNATCPDRRRSLVARLLVPYAEYLDTASKQFLTGAHNYVMFATVPGSRLMRRDEMHGSYLENGRTAHEFADIVWNVVDRAMADHEAGIDASHDRVVAVEKEWFAVRREVNADYLPESTAKALGIPRVSG